LAWLSEQLLGALQEDNVECLVIGVEVILGDESTPLGEAVQAVTEMLQDQKVSKEVILGFAEQIAKIPC